MVGMKKLDGSDQMVQRYIITLYADGFFQLGVGLAKCHALWDS